MKAKYATDCGLCTDGVAVGDDISRYLGDWVHTACRKVVLETGHTITVRQAETAAELARIRRFTLHQMTPWEKSGAQYKWRSKP